MVKSVRPHDHSKEQGGAPSLSVRLVVLLVVTEALARVE
jgi:hypothetical protein